MSVFPDTPGTLLRKIASLRNGDDAAEWADFVERYTPAVRAFFRLNGAFEADLDDLVQDVFVRLVDVLRERGYDARRARFRTYLATLMRNLLVDRWRASQTRAENLADAVPLRSASDAEPGTVLDVKWRLAVHEAAVEHVLTKTMLAMKTKAISLSWKGASWKI